MMKQFLRKFRRPSSSKVFTKTRRFTHERLEDRMMMTINPSGTEFLVNEAVPGYQGIEGSASSVAVSEAAGTLAVFSGAGAGTREGIFLRRYDASGAEQDVVLASSTIRGTRAGAVVAANEAGNSVVAWHGRGPGDKYGIFMQRFDVAGAKVGVETLVNETVRGEQHDPAVAIAADGSFVVTWSGPTASDTAGIFAQRFNADGTASGSEELVNTTTADYQIESAVAMNASGDYVITWSSLGQDGADWGVYGQRFDSAGARQGDEFQVNTTTAASQRESSVAMQDDGTFMVVWSSFGQDGDSWSVIGQRFDAAGAAVGDEILVNTSTVGSQRHAQIAGAAGKYMISWQSGSLNSRGWEVMTQEFDASGNRVGDEQVVNSLLVGSNSGHQEHPSVALNSAGVGAVVWSGQGATDRRGVYGRNYQDDATSEDNLTPDLATISDQTIEPNTELVLVVSATDPNAGDTLTYQLDSTVSPAGATIVRDDNNNATIRWTPTDADLGTTVTFRVLVTDDGVPPLADAEEFQVEVTDGRLRVDLNGPNEVGADNTSQFAIGAGPASIADPNLSISNAAGDLIKRTSVVLAETPNGSQEILSVDTLDTNIVATYTPALRRLLLSGDDTAENYERVLRTLTYNNLAVSPSGTRSVEVQVNGSSRLSNKPTITLTIGAVDLVGFAQALAASGTQFFGAAWCPHCTEQKELFEDGGQFLPFMEVTNADRTRNDLGDTNMIDVYPTWVFADDTRLEGVQSLQTLAERSGVAIPVATDPFVAPIADDTLLIGSPLHIPLDGYDANGGKLTYTVTTNNTGVTAEVLSGNQSARVNVAGYGDMVFELFEQRASRPTQRFIELANDDFYDGIAFHRILNDFVIQGGDPLGNGTGGSTLGDFDDQFHVDLQHNTTGLLSYAKGADDTNDSQFFITEGENANLRNLDFNHSIFGILVEGEKNRAAISDTEVQSNGSEVSDPVFDITMENVDIFQDDENAVVMLKADPGTTGVVTVTVMVEDEQGNTFERTFDVTIAEDTIDGRPFLADIPPVSTAMNTPVEIQLEAIDVEGDDFTFDAAVLGAVDFTFDLSDSGLLTVTPPTDFVGTLEIRVGVFPTSMVAFDSQTISIEVV